MASNSALAKIHVAKKQLNLCDDDYRSILEGLGVSKSSELDARGTAQLLEVFEGMGFKPTAPMTLKKNNTFGKQRYAEFNNRKTGDDLASGKQLRMLEAMWRTSPAVRDHSDAAFRHFLKRIAGVDRPEWLLKEKVQQVKIAIEKLGVAHG